MLNALRQLKGWKLQLVSGAGLLFALCIVALGRNTSPIKEPVFLPPVAPYQSMVAGIGIVEPKSEIINIGTELSGIVKSVYVKVGDIVKQNDPLFTLSESDIDAQIKTLEASLIATKIQAKHATAEFNIVQKKQYMQAVSKDDFNRRKYGAELAAARIIETQARLDEARTTKDRMTIKAPIDGEILSINIRVGEYAAAAMINEPLMRMGDTEILYVRVEIDEENAGRISANSVAKGSKRGDATKSIPLTFIRFEPYVQPKQNLAVAGQRVDTRVLQVIYALEATDNTVYIGEQMDVFLEHS